MSAPENDQRVVVRQLHRPQAAWHDASYAAAAESLGSTTSVDEPLPNLDIVCAAALADRVIPERSWVVPELIPDRQVTLLSGDGGVGKSLLALQLAVAMASGTDWIGTMPSAGPTLYLGAEDELDEMHRRIVDITSARSLGLTELGDLHLLSLAGKDAVLAAPEGREGLIAMAPLWRAVEARIAALRPRLLIVDNSADVFAGNEISRTQVRQFIGALRGAAQRQDMAVLLLSHPSLAGMANGSGTSGSTAWSNSARSRLYLDRPKANDGEEPDSALRTLRVMKANYAAAGSEFQLRWQAGVLRPEGPGLSGFDRAAAAVRAEDKFVELMKAFANQGRHVSHQPGPTFAPAIFAKHPSAGGVTKRGFCTAMEALLERRVIVAQQFGPPSKQRSRLALSVQKDTFQPPSNPKRPF